MTLKRRFPLALRPGLVAFTGTFSPFTKNKTIGSPLPTPAEILDQTNRCLKDGDPSDYPTGHGPQGDFIRIQNYARCVRTTRPGDISSSFEIIFITWSIRALPEQ